MPKGGTKLGDDDIATIRDWILSIRPDPRPLFASRCVSCHSGPSPVGSLNLTGNLEALAKLPETKFGDEGATSAVLYKRLADGSMPKNGVKLTEDELSYVKDWLNSLHPDPRPVFVASCVKCHGGATPAAGLDLTGDLNSLAGLKQVVKGKAGDSALYKRIADGTMPRGGQPLSDSEAGLVWDWIDSLTPRN
jgi:mono/diheme cytochrome c family protein